MATLKEKLAENIPKFRQDRRDLIAKYGAEQLSEVSVKQIFGGMRGVKGLICDTSAVDPDKGLIIRGIPIMDLRDKLPEDIWGLLLNGELPAEDILTDIKKEMAARCEVPGYVWDVMKAMPADSHPMCMLDTAILVMQRDSKFFEKYQAGMTKDEYWEPALEDSMNIIASLIDSDPDTAESVVEDLSELFRASLNDAGNQVPVADELDLCRRYVRIEALRLGDRLDLDWQVQDAPAGVRIPLLTLQPLLENAIYHGIQPRPDGGTITVKVGFTDAQVRVEISNPLPPANTAVTSEGNRMALGNIRSRLHALYGANANLTAAVRGEHFVTALNYPIAADVDPVSAVEQEAD